MKTNHEWTEGTRRHGPPSTTSGTKIRLQFCALGVTMSWDDGFLGARASCPHQAWHSLGHLPTWINRERRHGSPSAWPMLFPPTGWLPATSHSSSAAAKGTGCGRDSRAPRAITPPLRGSRRSRAARRRLMRWGVGAGRLLRKPTAPFGKLPFAREPGPRPAVRIIRGKTADR